VRTRHAVIPALAGLAAATPALAQGYGETPHMWGWSWGWGGMIFGPLMMILFVVVIAGAVALVIRWAGLGGAPGHHERHGYARHILDERYARGEIDKAEYEEKRRSLEG